MPLGSLLRCRARALAKKILQTIPASFLSCRNGLEKCSQMLLDICAALPIACSRTKTTPQTARNGIRPDHFVSVRMLDAYSLCWEMKIGDVKSRTKEAQMPVKHAFLQSCGRVSSVLI